ncbi:hypothetical protein [Williamsia sp. 1135]|uniref:hypothetical protein n=1 Tax=Williamsia sp. 1135 TaxID=1889262 RepID=UPI001F0B34DD|nr:hypothetical protein [Williamsia sp. 1135]
MSRSDLKEVGELLDDGDSGLILIAARDPESRVEKALGRAAKITTEQLEADAEQVSKEINEAYEALRVRTLRATSRQGLCQRILYLAVLCPRSDSN